MKVGLEVHQQLATGKLFCDCPADLSDEVVARVTRMLRATGGENRAVDAAAAFQASRGFAYEYEATPSSCLVELDEEPPHPIRPEAIEVAVTVALLLEARILDEIEVMRKIVVDGSNTAGFQRTALVAVDGHLDVDGQSIPIASVCLEEDAARKIGERSGGLTYRLDRLGIPLLEIATGPVIPDGASARAVAEAIGLLLRSTRRVRRGIGTIREDLNVSAPEGARVEIKGVQELRLIHDYVEREVERQRHLAGLIPELGRRHATVPEGAPGIVTDLVRSAAQGPIARTLARGGCVVGIPLPGFGGLLGASSPRGERLGRELADHARALGLGGLLHSDELPAQGIEGPLVDAIRAALGATGPQDAFVLLAAPGAEAAGRAARAVRRRARVALEGVPPETRDPLPDGRTRYSRPLPGRDRMYPETDVPPVPVPPDRLTEARRHLPERPEAVRRRLEAVEGLSREIAGQIYRAGEADRFFELLARGRAPAAIARLLTQELPELAADPALEAAVAALDLERIDGLLAAVERGTFSKEGVPKVLRALVEGAPDLSAAVASAGLSGLAENELAEAARTVVRRNAALVAARGNEAFQALMGELMREVRGRRDGAIVARALRAALAEMRVSEGA